MVVDNDQSSDELSIEENLRNVLSALRDGKRVDQTLLSLEQQNNCFQSTFDQMCVSPVKRNLSSLRQAELKQRLGYYSPQTHQIRRRADVSNSPLKHLYNSPFNSKNGPSKYKRLRHLSDSERNVTHGGGDIYNNNILMKQTNIIKLFDRSVDFNALCSEKSSSSLYAACRAWIKNDPFGRSESTKSTGTRMMESLKRRKLDAVKSVVESSGEERKSIKAKFEVHPMIPTQDEVEDGVRISNLVSIPSDVSETMKSSLESTIDSETSGSSATNRELLKDHVSRWRKINKAWRVASSRHSQTFAEDMMAIERAFVK